MQTLVYHGKMCLKYVINIDSNDCLSSHPVKGDKIYLRNKTMTNTPVSFKRVCMNW